MPTHTPLRPTTSPPSPRRAFTLLELIVVLVVLGLVAAIAIPTYQRITDGAEKTAARAQHEAVARAAAATVALRDGTSPTAALAAAYAEVSVTASGPGLSATGTEFTFTADGAPSTSPSEVSVAVAEGQLGWAVKVRPDFGINCAITLTGQTHGCWEANEHFTGAGAVLRHSSGGTGAPAATTTTTTTTTAPLPTWSVLAVGAGAAADLSNAATPVAVNSLAFGGASVTEISAGDGSSCALTDTNEMWCWGSNTNGQLGNGNTTASATPIKVALTDVIDMDAGEGHACAVTGDNSVWCWGANNYGQLGSSAPAARPPTQVRGPGGTGKLTDITAVELGSQHSCALDTSGGVWCWGMNATGQLGDNTLTGRTSPVQVLATTGGAALTNVTRVAAGANVSCAIKADTSLWCWGQGASGRIGDNGTANRKIPVQVKGAGGSGVLGGVTDLAINTFNTCAVTGGSVWCWGGNANGTIGDGTTTERRAPVQVTGVGGTGVLTGVTSVTAGRLTTCALTSSQVLCWGANTDGAMGVEGASHPTPVPMAGVDSISQISTSGRHTLLLSTP